MIPKFRAFHKEHKIMAHVKSIIEMEYVCIGQIPLFLEHGCLDIDYPHKNMWYFDHIHLMQCSGLKDAADKEVYVGDIIEYSSMAASFILPETPDVVIRQVVIFEDGIFGVKFGGHPYIEPLRNSFKYNRSEIKVIGNIYEHAHLLEKQ